MSNTDKSDCLLNCLCVFDSVQTVYAAANNSFRAAGTGRIRVRDGDFDIVRRIDGGSGVAWDELDVAGCRAERVI
jgi:hypothetical protein